MNMSAWITTNSSKFVDPVTLALEEGVLLAAPEAQYTSANYPTRYILQAASDSFDIEWTTPSHLRIGLCADGRDWVAKKRTVSI